MRVTGMATALVLRTGVNEAYSRVELQQERLASGRRINKYSDAPSDAVSSLRLRALERDWDAYQRQASDGLGRLNTADGTLQSASSAMQRVRDLATSAINGSLPDTSRKALSAEVRQLRDELATLANTTYQGSPLFAGFGSKAVAQVGGAWAYVGDDGEVLRQVSPDETTKVNLLAKDIFGLRAGVTDVFTLLDKVANDIETANTSGLGADLGAIDARAEEINHAQATVGAMTNRVEAAMDRGKVDAVALASQRAELEDVDVADAVLRLNQAQSGYQAALGATARASLPSLADFLR